MSDVSYIDRNLSALRDELAAAAAGETPRADLAGGISAAAESGKVPFLLKPENVGERFFEPLPGVFPSLRIFF